MKKHFSIYYLPLVLLLFTAKLTFAQDGALDSNFGTNGKVTTDIGSSTTDVGRDVAIQSDGKILVCGSARDAFSYDFAIVRYNSDGSLDNSFGTSGKVTIDFDGSNRKDEEAFVVLIQSDDKIILAGTASNGNDNDFGLVRLNSDGSLDNSFGTSGKVTTDIGGNYDYLHGAVLQSDGKIVVVGESYDGTIYNVTVARYNSDGTLDNSFGTNGKVTTTINGKTCSANDVVLQSDDKIVVAGQFDDSDMLCLRYNTNGTLDNTFDSDGIQTIDVNGSDNAEAAAIQSDGKIILVGNDGGDFAAVRLTSAGALDNTFDSDGKVSTDIGGTYDYDYGTDLIIQSDGKIVVAGYASIGSQNDFALVRYNSDGSLDTSFDTDGKQTTDLGGDDQANAIAVLSNDYLVLAGTKDEDFGVTKYQNSTATPVELISFTAINNDNEIILNWKTATEINNYGFQVERQKAKGESSWEEIGFV